jgi:hypothetical protein
MVFSVNRRGRYSAMGIHLSSIPPIYLYGTVINYKGKFTAEARIQELHREKRSEFELLANFHLLQVQNVRGLTHGKIHIFLCICRIKKLTRSGKLFLKVPDRLKQGCPLD